MDWKKQARSLIKKKKKKRDIGYEHLSTELEKIGIVEKPPNLSNKINRGTFSFVFALQVFKALGIDYLNLKDFT